MAERTSSDVKKKDPLAVWIAGGLLLAGAGGVGGVASVATNGGGEKGSGNSSGNHAPANPGQQEHQQPKIEKCRKVEGVLRIVGISLSQAEMVDDTGDINKIPNMKHERGDSHVKDVDVNEFELRWKPGLSRDDISYNEKIELWTAVNHHFYPFPEQNTEKLLGAKDSVIGHEFNIGPGNVAQVIQRGTASFCQ